MATNFPTSVDTFSNPTKYDALDSNDVPHAEQHANLNDAMAAVQAMFFTPGATGNAVLLATGRLLLKFPTDGLYYELQLLDVGGEPALSLAETGEAL